MTRTHDDDRHARSLGDLVEQLSRDLRELVRAELALAKAEVLESVRRAVMALGLAATGAVLGLFGLGTLVATAVIALANVWPAWLAALVVALVLVLFAGGLLAAGMKVARRAMPPAPTDAIESIKEDVAWVKTRARSGET